VNHFAVARTGFLSECAVSFKNDDFFPTASQSAGTSQADHPGSDDNRLRLESHAKKRDMD
jgi:hypothetical protein